MTTQPNGPRLGVLVVTCALASAMAVVPGATAGAECPVSGGTPFPPAAPPSPPAQVVFRGNGWGHGLGMSQYGAQGAARLGCTAEEIVTTYYTGTAVEARTDRPWISVRMLDDVQEASVIGVEGNVQWRNGPHLVATQRGGRYRIVRRSATILELRTNGRRVWSGTVDPVSGLRAVTGPSIITLDASVDTYGKLPMRLTYDHLAFMVHANGMDVIKVFRDNGGGRALDKYLFGIAEVPNSWPTEALRAQAIAARTFAYERNSILRPTSSDQTYSGYDQELRDRADGGRLRQAVLDTSRRVIVDRNGSAIEAFYSSSVGGYTEDNRYSFGGAEVAYLKPVDDSRWDRASDNPAHLRAWSTGRTRAQVASALGFDTITAVSVPPRGSPSRVNGVRVVGTDNGGTVTRYFTGTAVSNALGLRSPGFIVSMTR